MILGRLYDLALWPHPWLWPSSWNFTVRVWNTCSFISGLGRPIDIWNEKDVSHPFMTMILISLTMVGWADVPDSDWGDFRCWHAVDISSFQLLLWEHYSLIRIQNFAFKKIYFERWSAKCLPFHPSLDNVLIILSIFQVIEAARKGFHAVGIELNPWLVWYSRLAALRAGVRKSTAFHTKDLWKVSRSPCDLTCWPLGNLN